MRRNRMTRLVLLVLLVAGMAMVSGVVSSTPSPPSGAVAAVAKLYRDYAWEAVLEEPTFADLELFQQSGQVLGQYFEKHLVQLILRDRQCSNESHGVCRLDFSPMWSGQDPAATELKILPTVDPTIVSVEFTYPGDQSHVKLSYHLAKTPEGWRITDIQGFSDGNWSLRNILESKQP